MNFHSMSHAAACVLLKNIFSLISHTFLVEASTFSVNEEIETQFNDISIL